MSVNIARIQVAFAEQDPYSSWHREMWAQIGFVHTPIVDGMLKLGETDVLVLFGRGEFLQGDLDTVKSWVDSGIGSVICIGGTWGLESSLGLKPAEASLCHSREKFSSKDPNLADLEPFLFVGGPRMAADDATVFGTSERGDVLHSRKRKASFLAFDPGRTLCLFGLGRSVGGDLIGPGDGTAHTEDGRNRAEDGSNLMWSDREEYGGTPVFATPHIDLLREVIARSVIAGCEACNLAPAIVWHWPDNANAAAVCSIEWDTVQADSLKKCIGLLGRFGLNATWLSNASGKPQDLYRALRQFGHEFGLLYRAENGQLKVEQLRMQYVNISRLTSSRTMAASRGEAGYWHGLTSIYEAIEGAGGLVSFAKGGDQKGTTGFLFGTSRPFFPVHRTGRSIQVLEIPYCVHQPGIVTPLEFVDYAVENLRKLAGCLHFTFKPSTCGEIGFEDGLQHLFTKFRNYGYRSFLPDRLHEYERLRRALKVSLRGGTLSLTTDRNLPGLTIMVGGDGNAVSQSKQFEVGVTKRYGRDFTCATFDLDARQQVSVLFESTSQAA